MSHYSTADLRLFWIQTPPYYVKCSNVPFPFLHLRSQDFIDRLYDLFLLRGVPDHIRSDNGPEFTSRKIRKWLASLGVKTLFIELGSPWENGYVESFNGKLRDELLNREIFTTLLEAKVLLEQWRREYNEFRPHSARGYQPPAPVAVQPVYTPVTLT